MASMMRARMGRAVLAVMFGIAAGAGFAASPDSPDASNVAPDTSLSPQCQAPGSKIYTIAPLKGLRLALRQKRSVKVLAIGSSSTAGVGATSPLATYPARLEIELEGKVKGVDFDVINRGISGEVATEMALRMQYEVYAARPDLVIWQVGTNAALARIDADEFREVLTDTLQWLKAHKIDVVLVDPQYTETLAADPHYARIVKTIDAVAAAERVPLLRRFDAMKFLGSGRPVNDYLAGDRFHMNDLGYRCMAEHLARAITLGVLQAEASAQPAK
jgi:lysophospholipase L1-like esterase